jgi:hypothetical protein
MLSFYDCILGCDLLSRTPVVHFMQCWAENHQLFPQCIVAFKETQIAIESKSNHQSMRPAERRVHAAAWGYHLIPEPAQSTSSTVGPSS